jgi:uncharacterized caspase-like protein
MDGDGSKKAIVIAVSDYDLLQPLSFCKNDGNEMANLLKSLNYEIQESHELIGRVKWDDLRCAIIDFFRNRTVKPKDTLFFYYSGHGVLDPYGDHYLAPSEMDPFEPDTKGFLFDELTKMIDKSNSQRTVTVLDCCYSGAVNIGKGGGEEDAANAGRKIIDEKSRILERGDGKCILAASQAYQKAFETTLQEHSLFTYYLIEGLRGSEETVDNYGCVTPDSLGRYVYDKIMSLPPEQRPAQKPIRKVQQSGDIVLAYYPQFSKTNRQDSRMLEESLRTPNSSYVDSSMSKYEVDKRTSEFDNKVKAFENCIKEDKKYQRTFNIIACARELGITINEVRAIISYLSTNRFKCVRCSQRFKTAHELDAHNKMQH